MREPTQLRAVFDEYPATPSPEEYAAFEAETAADLVKKYPQPARGPIAAHKARGEIARRQARAENGDFTILCATRPLDPELRRLARAAARHHKTRRSAKQ